MKTASRLRIRGRRDELRRNVANVTVARPCDIGRSHVRLLDKWPGAESRRQRHRSRRQLSVGYPLAQSVQRLERQSGGTISRQAK